ncbi:MAG: hypothetical protein GY950_31520 [bacterium]|nr:hypothetical protein [bacterium]
MEKKNLNDNSGFSLVEALVAMAIIAFVVVTILGGFSHQQMATRKITEKNVAIVLAELRMQDLLKFPSTQLTPGITTEYVMLKGKDFEIFPEAQNPNDPKQLRRITVIEAADVLGQMMSIKVLVEYGLTKRPSMAERVYPYRIILSTRRGG